MIKRKPKPGSIYIAEITFPDGTKKLYTGKTQRPVQERIKEHLYNQKISNRRSFVGRGVDIKLIGSIYSEDIDRAERAVKRMSKKKRLKLVKEGSIF